MRLATLHSDTYEWHLCLKELILKIQMGFLQPCAFLLSLFSFTARHCEANWKALSSLRLVLEWAVLRNLSYLLSTQPWLAADKTPLFRASAFSVLPHWSQTRCCGSGRCSTRGPNLSQVQRNQKAPGWTQTWPRASHLVWVNNTSWMACLQSPQQGQKTLLNLSGWLSDVEQMCWNGENYVTSFSPLSCDHDD